MTLVATRGLTPREQVEQSIRDGYTLVSWRELGDAKGPTDTNWVGLAIEGTYARRGYQEGLRYGFLTGVPLVLGKTITDVDLDWAPGSAIAQCLLPATAAVFGRPSKQVSHCVYTTPTPQPSKRFEDPIDKTCLLELRCAKADGSPGLQSMFPPSMWSKAGRREPLAWVKNEGPHHVDTELLRHRVTLAAIAMLMAKHLGINGFGHEPRLALAGYLLRAGVIADDVIAVGEAISPYCNNREVHDVRTAVESTATKLAKGDKATGRAALARVIGDNGQKVLDRSDEWLGVSAKASRGAAGASLKTQLVQRMLDSDAEFFYSPDGLAYATVAAGEHRETMTLSSRAFSDYLSGVCYATTQKVPGGGDLKDAIRVLIAHAKQSGVQHDVFIRVARLGDEIYVDLGRPEWDAVRITRDGWEVVSKPTVKFRRSRGLLALPLPVRGTESLAVMLKKIINVEDPRLLLSWLHGALRGRKPFAILAITGEQGSAKSTAQRILRRIIDPNTADLRIPPKEPRDLMIAAMNSLVIAFDNLSVIPEWLSDALCGLATGGGFSTRELFSDLDETLFRAERPIMLNGITAVVNRPDLLDRSITETLEPIADDKRRSESDLERAFAEAHPALLAGLFDAAAMALANEATTHLDSLPRMADFASWVAAAGPALGWADGEFIEAYRKNQNDAIDGVIEGDAVIDTIKELTTPWEGQLKTLHALIPESEHKPKSPRGLRSALTRKAPALRHLGYTLTYTKGHEHKVIISKNEDANAEREPLPF